MLCVPIPEQHHALCQAAHQQVGVGVAIHVQPSAESVAKGLHAGRAQLCPTDHLWGGEALLIPCKWGLQPPYPFLWGEGGSKPGWGCAAVLRRCCGRCTLCLAPQREPPQRCLGVHGGGGQPHRDGEGLPCILFTPNTMPRFTPDPSPHPIFTQTHHKHPPPTQPRCTHLQCPPPKPLKPNSPPTQGLPPTQSAPSPPHPSCPQTTVPPQPFRSPQTSPRTPISLHFPALRPQPEQNLLSTPPCPPSPHPGSHPG